jgi:DNA polymerase
VALGFRYRVDAAPSAPVAFKLGGGAIDLTGLLRSAPVGQWREANHKIQKFWYDCDKAARAAIQMGPRAGMTVGPQKVKFQMGEDLLKGCLLVSLPSGRDLVYRNARLEADDGKFNITYDGVNQYTRKWQAIRSYGGKLVENITQAVARDLMASAMVNIERAGLWLVSTIHDELIVECPSEKADAAFSTMKSIMCEAPDWADGLPLGGEGFISERYGKG